MHMSDALLSPVVGVGGWVVAAAFVGRASWRLARDGDDRRLPLMGVMGAFVFAAQMINFAIPGTGSSGHLGGGMLLAILLGPHAALIAMTSILLVQALLFADGGLLALGCNIINLGVVPAFLAWPLVYRGIAGGAERPGRVAAGAFAGAVAALQLGAFGVVAETAASGVSALPFGTFLAFMQPIHLAIGIVEGMVTAAVLGAVLRLRPDILRDADGGSGGAGMRPPRWLGAAFLAAALLAGGVLSWFASENPDGLEWSVARTGGEAEAGQDGFLHRTLASAQAATALLPDYALPGPGEGASGGTAADPGAAAGAARAETSLAGLAGVAVTLALIGLAAVGFRVAGRRGRKAESR